MVSVPGIISASARAEAGGTIRSWAGMTQRLGSASRLGSTGRPAMRQVPRAGVFSPYQPPRHSRATGAASGTPSFSQSSSATKAAAFGLAGSRPEKATNLRATSCGSRLAKSDWMESTGSSPQASMSGASAGSAAAASAPWTPASAWKSQGVASNARPSRSPWRRSASARASNPPMQ